MKTRSLRLFLHFFIEILLNETFNDLKYVFKFYLKGKKCPKIVDQECSNFVIT